MCEQGQCLDWKSNTGLSSCQTGMNTKTCTLCEGGDGVARLLLALQEAVLWLGGDLIDQLFIVGVRVHGQQLPLCDQVGGLTGDQTSRNNRNYCKVITVSL